MADPLSVLASMIAVSEAGMKIAKSLYSFANAPRSSGDDIERLAFELDTFSSVLDDLHTWLKDNQQVISQPGLDTANKILRRCKKTFGDIKKMIGTGADEHFDPPRFWNRIRSSKRQLLEEKKLRVRVEHNVVQTQHSLVRWQRAEFNNQHIPYPSASQSPHDSNWLLSLVPSLKLPAIPRTPYPMLPSPEVDKKEREKEKRSMNDTVKTLLSAWTNINEGDSRRWTVNQPSKQGRKPRNIENPLHPEPDPRDKQTTGEAILSLHNDQPQRVETRNFASASQDPMDKMAQISPDRQNPKAIHNPEKVAPESHDASRSPTPDDGDEDRAIIDEVNLDEIEDLDERGLEDKEKVPMKTERILSYSPSIDTIDLPQDGIRTGQAIPILQSSLEGDRLFNPRTKPDLNISVEADGLPMKASSKSHERRVFFQEPQIDGSHSKSNTSPSGSRESVDSFASSPPKSYPPPASQIDHDSNLHPTYSTPYYSDTHSTMPYGPTGYITTRSHMSSVPSFPTAPSAHGDGRFAPRGPYAYPYDRSAYRANYGMDYASGFVEEIPAQSHSSKRKSKGDSGQDEVFRQLEGLLTKYRQEEVQLFQDSFDAFVKAQDAANSAQRAHQQEVKAAIRSAAEEAKKQSMLRLISADGKTFQFPFASCRTWKEMKLLIEKAHRQNYPELDLDDHASFFLTEGDANFILPELWEDTVAPCSTITVRLRIFEQDHSDGAYDGASEQAESPEEDSSEVSSSSDTSDLPRSPNHGKDLETPRKEQRTKTRQRNVRVDKPPPAPTPPPAVPRSTRQPSSNDESSSSEEDNSPNKQEPGKSMRREDRETAAQRSLVRGRTNMYKDLNSHFQQVMDVEASFAKVRAKQKITSMLTQENILGNQAHERNEFKSPVEPNGQSAIPQMYGGISNTQDVEPSSSERPFLLTTGGRHAAASQQTTSLDVTPNTPSNEVVGFPQVSPRHPALENDVPDMHSTLTVPSSPQPQMTIESQKTALELKVDYLTSLITKREQDDRARDLMAKQAADEEKLKQLEDKLLRPTDKRKDQIVQTSSIAGSSTLNESLTGNPAEQATARPSLAVAGTGSSVGHSSGRRSFRRRFLGRSTSTSAVTP
ncbi:MAG: hypothetical protein Q9160_001434 [Pyrenula sp. 1 TL-2023]